MEESKKWYQSKTLWANVVAGVAGLIQSMTGTAWIDPEAQIGILALVNVVLRIITKTSLKA